MPLSDENLKEFIVQAFNENKHVKLDGSERIDFISKEIANLIFRAWAVETS